MGEGGNQMNTPAWATASHRPQHPRRRQEAVLSGGSGQSSGVRQTRVWTLALLCIGSVTLDKLLNFSETRSLICDMSTLVIIQFHGHLVRMK